jgi:lipoprotein-anchoring transpeptidase ErfK/SrfK
VSPGFLVEVNKLGSATNLRAGVAIRVPLGEPRIVIQKGEFRLYFLLGGGYVQDFPVGLGREGTTPEGTFVIDEMIRNPDWHPRAGVIIPHGDPNNILGSRWLAFKDTPDHQGFGIHGTTEPSSIGKEASSGCVRMLRDDVERLFEWTARGTTVVISR